MNIGRDKPWTTELWEVSPYNFAPEVRADIKLRDDIIINDCTLREGEQQAGVVFRPEDKVRLAKVLDEIGIHELEAGQPSVSKGEQEAVTAICKAGLKARIRANCMALKADVDLALNCGVQQVIVSLPSGYLQIQYKLKWPEERMIETAVSITNYAHEKGLYVVFSPFDTTRSDYDFLERYLKAVVTDGHVDRLRLVDTTGATTPLAIKYLVKKMIGCTNVPLEIHSHNDFGLGTANVLAGLEAGASVASTSLNGMGERAGNAATEEVALALRMLYNVDLGLKLEKFKLASSFLEELSGVKLQRHKAVVGDNAFDQEAGAIVAGWLVNPFVAEAYLPEVVGQKTEIIMGKWTGKTAVAWKLKELGISANDEQLATITTRIKEEAERRRLVLSEEEIRAISRDTIG